MLLFYNMTFNFDFIIEIKINKAYDIIYNGNYINYIYDINIYNIYFIDYNNNKIKVY